MVSHPDDVVSYLAKMPLFQGLPKAIHESIAEVARLFRVVRGSAILTAGEPCTGLCLLVDGLAKVMAQAENGQEKVVEILSPGASLSETWCLEEGVHTASVRALVDVKVLWVPRQTMQEALHQHPELAVTALRNLSQRNSRLLQDIRALTLYSGSRRVVDYLLRAQAQNEPGGSDNQAVVSLPTSKGTIASLLSVTPEHFSRILHELQANGLIAVHRRQIHIPDLKRLQSVA